MGFGLSVAFEAGSSVAFELEAKKNPRSGVERGFAWV
tara:strand:- start:623 stop:733 length:111 start_codon:yes stop_codon:yes gene_type:complete